MQHYNNIIILVLKGLHNFNVVDICLTAEQVEGDQGALSHHTSLVHYALEPNTILYHENTIKLYYIKNIFKDDNTTMWY